MGEITLRHVYQDSAIKIWRALTDPELTALWSMRPEGYEPVVGNRFKLIWKPVKMWRGYFDAEVLEVSTEHQIRYSWDADGKSAPLMATFTLVQVPAGIELSLNIAGMKGIAGNLFGKRIFAPGMQRELDNNLPRLLVDLDETGHLKPDSTLKPLV